jgi:hypothetical protein
LTYRIATIARDKRKISVIVKTIDRSFLLVLLFLPFLLLLPRCTPLARTTDAPSTPPSQAGVQPEGPTLSPEQELELFNRNLDRA